MIIYTQSGPVTLNKKERYAHWIQGYQESGAWTGATTLADAWKYMEATVESAQTMREAYLIGFAHGMRDQQSKDVQEGARSPSFSGSSTTVEEARILTMTWLAPFQHLHDRLNPTSEVKK